MLADYCGQSQYVNQGERVVAGQHLMQAVSDIFLGWERTTGTDGVERDFYVRQLRDWKLSAPIEQMAPAGMQAYARPVRLDPCPRARPLWRPHRARGLPRQVRRLRRRDRQLRPGLRGPERGGPRGTRQRGCRRSRGSTRTHLDRIQESTQPWTYHRRRRRRPRRRVAVAQNRPTTSSTPAPSLRPLHPRWSPVSCTLGSPALSTVTSATPSTSSCLSANRPTSASKFCCARSGIRYARDHDVELGVAPAAADPAAPGLVKQDPVG